MTEESTSLFPFIRRFVCRFKKHRWPVDDANPPIYCKRCGKEHPSW